MNTPSNSKTPLTYLKHFQQLPHTCFLSFCIPLIPNDLRTLQKTWGVYPPKSKPKRNFAQFQNETATLSYSAASR
jgi:hypothetical protein